MLEGQSDFGYHSLTFLPDAALRPRVTVQLGEGVGKDREGRIKIFPGQVKTWKLSMRLI